MKTLENEIKLKLRDENGKEKIYICDFISLATYEQALEVKHMFKSAIDDGGEFDQNAIDKGIKLLLNIYKGQFTYDDVVNGLKPSKAFYIFLEHAQLCLGELTVQSTI